jgi:putative addiction module killer protein
MFTIEKTEEFDEWLSGIKDSSTKVRLLRRLGKVGNGNLGDVEPVGDGVYEMREHFGPGFRMYYAMNGKTVILMLGGGSKSGQQGDIERAKEVAARYLP